jgi:hypothetical protein
MKVGGRANIDHLLRLWQLQNNALAAQQSSKVDKYKQVVMSKEELEKVWNTCEREKRRRSKRNRQNGATGSLAHHKQEDSREQAQNTTANPLADPATFDTTPQNRIGSLDDKISQAIGTTIDTIA